MRNFIAKTRGYPSQFWLLFWGLLLSMIGSSMIWPYLMLYASERLHLPLTQTATLITINSTASLIMTFIAGHIADRAGRKIVMVFSLFLNAAVYVFLSQAATYAQFAILMFLLGASNPLFRIGANAMLVDLIEPVQRADAFAFQRLSFNAGISIGPAAGGFLAAVSQYLAFYVAAAGLFLFGLVLMFFAVETLPEKEAGTTTPRGKILGGYGRVFKDWPFITTNLNLTLGLITAALMWVLLPVYATQEIGVPKQQFGFVLTTNAVMVVLFQVAVTQWTKNFPPLRMIGIGMLFYAVGTGSVALGAGFWGFWISMVIVTIGELIVAPTITTFVANLAPADMRGRYMSIYGLTWSLSIGIGPLFGGFLGDNYGPSTIWIGGLAVGFISAILFFVIERFIDQKKHLVSTAN